VSVSRFFRRGAWDAERAGELESYLAIETDENIARGMSPSDARDAAHCKLGNVTLIREEIYQMNTMQVIDSAWRDLKYGARLLRLNPAFASVAVLSLALGVGANTAIFQLLDAVRIRTLPVKNADELAEIRIAEPVGGRTGQFSGRRPSLTNPLWEQIRDRQQVFTEAFAWSAPTFDLTTGGEARHAQGLWVSGDFFSGLGVPALIGRTLTAADDRRGCAAPPAVLSYGFWQREYAGSPAVIGRSITLDGHPFDIVGVTPATFFGVEVGRAFDVAVPLCAEPFSRGARTAMEKRDVWFLGAMGRLKPGVSLDQARAQLASISAPIFRATLPSYRAEDEKHYLEFKIGAYPGGTGISQLRRQYESPLWLLLATTGLVLLIACANLANLMLARATAREREIAVRLAIGASRGRIVRQLLAESLLIAAIGSACGAALAQWLSRFMVGFLTTENNRIFVALTVDWRIFAFTAVLGVLTCLVFGLVPAIRATGSGDEGGQPRVHGRPRAVRHPARARRGAGRAVARPCRRRGAVRAQPAQPDDARCRLPPGRRAGRRPGPAPRRRSGRKAHGAVCRPDGQARRDSGSVVGGADVHRAGQRQRVEQQHRHRREEVPAERELQLCQRGLFPHDGDAAAGGTRLRRARAARGREVGDRH
jgi:hypothetical protein